MMTKDERGFSPWTIQIIGLAVQAAVTYGIMSTQIQWMRADINRLEVQIAKVEARYEAKAKP
jgi:hypothetical protein